MSEKFYQPKNPKGESIGPADSLPPKTLEFIARVQKAVIEQPSQSMERSVPHPGDPLQPENAARHDPEGLIDAGNNPHGFKKVG